MGKGVALSPLMGYNNTVPKEETLITPRTITTPRFPSVTIGGYKVLTTPIVFYDGENRILPIIQEKGFTWIPRKEEETLWMYLEHTKDVNPQFRGFSPSSIGLGLGLCTQEELDEETKRLKGLPHKKV